MSKTAATLQITQAAETEAPFTLQIQVRSPLLAVPFTLTLVREAMEALFTSPEALPLLPLAAQAILTLPIQRKMEEPFTQTPPLTLPLMVIPLGPPLQEQAIVLPQEARSI